MKFKEQYGHQIGKNYDDTIICKAMMHIVPSDEKVSVASCTSYFLEHSCTHLLRMRIPLTFHVGACVLAPADIQILHRPQPNSTVCIRSRKRFAKSTDNCGDERLQKSS